MSLIIDLADQTVIVTGATGGIGTGIARRFHAAGATVVLHHRSGTDTAATLAEELGGAFPIRADLTDEKDLMRLVDEAVERTGRLDGVVNNAGIQHLAQLADMDDAAWDEMIGTNLTAVHRVSQAAAERMERGGWITHISSIEASQPAFSHGHYSVAKAGLVMHARSAALEWGPRGIRVNSVSPGLIGRKGIETQWPDGVARWQAAAPLKRLGTPEDIGDACVFLASEMARWITGVDLVVDGGVSTHPTW